MDRPLIAVTIGDPAGIGPEIVVRAAATEAVRQSAGLVIVGDRRIIERAMDVTRVRLPVGEDAALIDLANVPEDVTWGKIQRGAGAAAGQFIERAVQEAREGRVDAIATAPINKDAVAGGLSSPRPHGDARRADRGERSTDDVPGARDADLLSHAPSLAA